MPQTQHQQNKPKRNDTSTELILVIIEQYVTQDNFLRNKRNKTVE